MGLVSSLSELQRRMTNCMVYVKIMTIWNHPPKNRDEITTMILADVKGKRMDATIPTRVYNESFRTRLREGKWYLLSDFKVVLHTKSVRWNFFHEYDFHMIKIAKPEEKQFVVDTIGLIHSVDPVEILPWVTRPGESDFEKRYITFTIKDTLGRFMNCVALGKAGDDFLLQWEERVSRVQYTHMKIIASLQFWRISEYKGNPCLLAEEGCSRTFIDPNFPNFDKAHYISAFSICEEEELREEVVDSNF
ncbi:unnamed protein product [Arabidopsis halleri]